MPLFDMLERTEREPKRYGVSDFQYLNTSARPGIVAIREMLEGWFGRFPIEAATDLRARFCSDRQHKGAFFELYVHELMRRLDFEVDVHPSLESTATTRPDFLVSQRGNRLFFIEATTTQPSDIETGEQARINQVYDCLNKMDSPNFFLALRVSGAPATPPPATRLRKDLSTWLATLDPDQVHQAARSSTGFEVFPSLEWQHEGWNIVFSAVPKSVENRGTPEDRPIGMIMPDAFVMVDTDRVIEGAIARKADRYGKLDLPFVIAVNLLEDFCDTGFIMDGLLGERFFTEAPNRTPGPLKGNRRPNGAWYGPKGPRRRNVSAVLIGHQISPHSIVSTPGLVHNPWALLPLPDALWPLPQWIPIRAEDKLKRKAGSEARSVFGLPET